MGGLEFSEFVWRTSILQIAKKLLSNTQKQMQTNTTSVSMASAAARLKINKG